MNEVAKWHNIPSELFKVFSNAANRSVKDESWGLMSQKTTECVFNIYNTDKIHFLNVPRKYGNYFFFLRSLTFIRWKNIQFLKEDPKYSTYFPKIAGSHACVL